VTLASLGKEMACSEIGENILSKEVVGGLAFLSRRFYGAVLPQMPSIRAVWRKANYEFVEGGIVALPGREALKEACSRPLEIREIRRMQRKAAQPRIGLFAGEDIDPGALITEFLGHVQLPSLLSPLSKGQSLASPAGNQFILLVPRVRPLLCVDARKFGSPTRHIRRSCRPNCELKIVLTGDAGSGQVHFCVFARNALQEGDELFLPIDEDAVAALESLGWRVECACGNPDFCLAPASVLAPLAVLSTTAAVRKSASLGGSLSFDSYMQASTTTSAAQPLRAKTPQQPQAQPAQPMQPPVKLSREDRKLLQYIEHFEKMDQSERKSASRKSSAGPSGMASSTEAVSSAKSPSSPATSSPATGSGSGGAKRKTKANAAGSPQRPAKQKASASRMATSNISEDEHANDEDTFESSDAGTEERPLPVKRPSTTSPKQQQHARKKGPGSPPKKAKTKAAREKEGSSEDEMAEQRRPKSKSLSGPHRGSLVAFSDDDDDDESGNVDVDGEDSFTAGIAYSSSSNAAAVAHPSSARSSLTTTPPPPASGEAGSATSQQETPSKKRVSLSDYMRMRKSSATTTAANRADGQREDKEEGELVSPSLAYHPSGGYHHHQHHQHHQKQQEHQYYQHQHQQQLPLPPQPYYQLPSSSSTGNAAASCTAAAPSRRFDAPTLSTSVSTSSDPYDHHPQQPPQRHEGYERRGHDADRKATPPPPTAFDSRQQPHYTSGRPSGSGSYRDRQSSMRDPRDYPSSSYQAGGSRYSTTSLSTEQRDPRDPSYHPQPPSSSSSFAHHSRDRDYPPQQQQPGLGRSYSSGALGDGHRKSSAGTEQGGYRPRPSLLKAAEEVPTRWEEAQAAARKQEDGDADKSGRWPPQSQSSRYANYPPYSGSGGSGQPPRRQ
jgi:hypothetical protein